MYKKILIALVVGLGFSAKAFAYSENFDKGFSTATYVAVTCSSGTTPANITQSLTGFKVGQYRVTVDGNANPAGTVVRFGYNSNVSIETSPWLGVPVIASSTLVFQLGNNPDISAPVSLWCEANKLATSGAKVILEIFGYK